MSTTDSESDKKKIGEKDVARVTGQLEGTENRENSDPGNGPLSREGGYAKGSEKETDDKEID